MTSRADVERLAASSRRLVELAKDDLRALVGSLDLSRPELVRDFLVEVVPVLAAEYGQVAAAAAAEWYEETRAAQAPGSFAATVAPAIDDAAVVGSVRWAAGDLFTDDALAAFSKLEGALQRHITYAARETIMENVLRDPARPAYARVPRGSVTCAFCSMLASRGFVYSSAGQAQRRGRGATEDKYHDDCDCQVVPSWDAESAHIEGYDPDGLFAVYEKAREEAGSNDPNDIAAAMRRLEPDRFTDGIHTH